MQIADALVDYMRDLMVLKSAGAKTELLVMTEQQRKQAAELAEKFDLAGLIYNITALEKLRWVIKSTDTARALLEAGILRMALSEHFLNVDSLIAQLKNCPAGHVKKNLIVNRSTQKTTPISPSETATAEQSGSSADSTNQPDSSEQKSSAEFANLESVKGNWQNIMAVISEKLGKSTATLLGSADVSGFADGVLTITFPAVAKASKAICESNGRAGKIEGVLKESFGAAVRLKFEVSDDVGAVAESSGKPGKTNAKQRADIINDPAVKTVLMELGGTIMGIEQDQ